MDTVLGEMEFSIGFKMVDSIVFCGDAKAITIKIKAYFVEDGITAEQNNTMKQYKDNRIEITKKFTKLATEHDSDAKERFIPRTLLFGRDGECALLCDDEKYPDEGIAICVFPNEAVVSLDDYL